MDENRIDPVIEENDAEFQDLTKKSTNVVLIALVSVLAVVVVVLSIVLIKVSSNVKESAPEGSTSTEAADTGVTEYDASTGAVTAPYVPSVSYTHSDPAYFTPEILSAEVAACAGLTLTNETLCYYYWQSFYTFMNYYGYSAYYFMDPAAALDTQQATEDMSMDQYFMEYGLSDFQLHAAFYQMMQNDPDFVLPEAYRNDLDNMAEALTENALANGYSSADEYLQASFGPYCSVESYCKYIEIYLCADAYYEQYVAEHVDSLTFTEDEMSAYYDENADDYASNGVAKDDTRAVDIRHILITPAEVALSADDAGYAAAVEEAKAEAKAKAEALLEQWLAGDRTEESFAVLAGEHTADPGSAQTGGLYEDVLPGQMVESFNDWCFDSSRQIGDYGIVETDYGYHIMFFSGRSDMLYWQTWVTADLQNNAYYELIDALKEATPMTSDLSKAAVYPVNVA